MDDSFDRKQTRRTVIQYLLADQFGDALINDARFQMVVDKVTEAISETPEGATLLDRVLVDLGQPANKV